MLSLRLALDYTSGPYHIKGEDLGLPLCLHPLSTPCRSYSEGLFPHQLDWLPWVAMESVILHRNPTGSFLQREKKKKLCCQLPKLFAIWEQFFILQKRSFVESVDRASFLSTLSRGKENLKSCYKRLAPANWPCALTLFINTFRITKSDFMQEIHILICLVSHYCLWPLGLIKWCLLDLIALLQFISRKSFSSWPHPETRKEHEVPTLLVP